MTEHHLKTWPEYFTAVLDGTKTVELRREDGRHFDAGDVLVLEEWCPPYFFGVMGKGGYTGRSCRRVITHVLRDSEGWWLQPGVVALSLREEA